MMMKRVHWSVSLPACLIICLYVGCNNILYIKSKTVACTLDWNATLYRRQYNHWDRLTFDLDQLGHESFDQ